MQQQRTKGFTFIEILTALSIIAISTIGVLVMRDWVVGNHRVSEAKMQIATIEAGAQMWRPRTGGYAGISFSELSETASIPSIWQDGSNVNPWGGDIEVNVDSGNPQQFEIRLLGIREFESGEKLLRDLAERAISASFDAGILSVTFAG